MFSWRGAQLKHSDNAPFTLEVCAVGKYALWVLPKIPFSII
jgi:hypothetical protein